MVFKYKFGKSPFLTLAKREARTHPYTHPGVKVSLVWNAEGWSSVLDQ